MTSAEYVEIITEAMETAGTNLPQYELAVLTLADILERRDAVATVYEKNAAPVIRHTNKAGATNYEQNPVLRMLNDCNKTALLYMRELGLTPQALRKINPSEAKTTLTRGKGLFEKLKGDENED